MLSLLNKISRQFKSATEILLMDQLLLLNHSGWSVREKDEDFFLIEREQVHLKLRKKNSTDLKVFNQVFNDLEYGALLTCFQLNSINLSTMIDAGSNIGLTSVFFKQHFPLVQIACIEPDTANVEILKENLKTFLTDTSVQIFQAGLMGVSDLNLNIGNDFRGGGDWAKQTIVSKEHSDLKSITIQRIAEQMNFDSIDLLKIDIEGAEVFLIDPKTDVSFLTKTKVIAIEIHDEYNCREQIHTLLKKYHFTLLEVGETTLAINQNLL